MQISKQQLGWEERCRVWGERPGQARARLMRRLFTLGCELRNIYGVPTVCLFLLL